MSSVMSVLGPVAAGDIGLTLPHEHLLLDLRCLWNAPRHPAREPLVDAPVTAALHGTLLTDPYHSRDNLLLNDSEVAIEELDRFAALGGRTVVDLSTRTIGPYPDALVAIARQTGLHIVAGCGFYTRRAHPAWLAAATVEQLAESMIRDLTEGFADLEGRVGPDRPRAGIIGEIGTSSPIHPDEERVLIAAAHAQHATGAAINVHLAIFAQEGPRVLEILERAGADLARVALSHLDENLDPAYHLAIARRGAYLEFDTFGSECRFDEDGLREPFDSERIAALLRLLDAGYERQLLLSQDVCTKMHLHRYGGHGYDHLLRTIVPNLRQRGLSQNTLELLLRRNPARLLSGEDPTSAPV